MGPCSSQPLAPTPPASTGWVCSRCPGRKATATWPFGQVPPPTSCGLSWVAATTCPRWMGSTEVLFLHAQKLLHCVATGWGSAGAAQGWQPAAATHISVCRGVAASSSPPASHTACAPCSRSQLPLSWSVTVTGTFTIFMCIKMTLLLTALLLLFLGPQIPQHHSWESPNVFRPLLSGKQLCV